MDEKDDFFKIINLYRSPLSNVDIMTSNFGKVYTFFKREIETLLGEVRNEERMSMIEKIQNSLLVKFVMVDVKLDVNEDPYSVFESLNTTGMDLTNWDLIKNYILMKFNNSEQQKNINEDYFTVIEDRLSNSTNSMKIRDEFMRHFLGSYGIIVTANKIYATTKGLIESTFIKLVNSTEGPYLNFLNSLKKASEYYAKFYDPEKESNVQLRGLLQNLLNFPYTVHYPVLIQIYRMLDLGRIDEEEMLGAIKYIETYILRREIVGEKFQGLNKQFPQVCKDLEVADPEKIINTIKTRLEVGNYRIPNDDELRQAFFENKLGKESGADVVKYILYNIEKHINKEVGELSLYQLEHIFPQNPSPACDSYYGSEMNELQNVYLNRIGNLTLTGYNSHLSNFPFDEKLIIVNGYRDSGLKITKQLSKYSTWGIDNINDRAQWLYEQALKVWPLI
jgi:hypothetical protein